MNWQGVVHEVENEPNLSPPMCNKEVGGMSSWEMLSFNVINLVLREKKMEVEMACARETLLLLFSSSEVKGTETCRAVPFVKASRELWAES